MFITNNNTDILFDDLAFIGLSNQSATVPLMYGDCNNRFETETAESAIPETYAQFSDCTNN